MMNDEWLLLYIKVHIINTKEENKQNNTIQYKIKYQMKMKNETMNEYK